MNPKNIPCQQCNGQMFHRIFESCFGDTAEFYECPDCGFVLDKAYPTVDKFGCKKPRRYAA